MILHLCFAGVNVSSVDNVVVSNVYCDIRTAQHMADVAVKSRKYQRSAVSLMKFCVEKNIKQWSSGITIMLCVLDISHT